MAALTDKQLADAWARSGKGDLMLRLLPFARAVEKAAYENAADVCETLGEWGDVYAKAIREIGE
jgi:hypothetical protein